MSLRTGRWRDPSEKRALHPRGTREVWWEDGQWGAGATLQLTECVGEERDPVTEVHTDRGPDVMSPDHPLGLQFHGFSLGYFRYPHRAPRTLMSSPLMSNGSCSSETEKPCWTHRLRSWKPTDGMCETTQGSGHCERIRGPSTEFSATPT